MTPFWLPIVVLFGCLAIGLVLGLPMVFAVGGSAAITALIFEGPQSLGFIYQHTYSMMRSLILVAMPLFIFMACVLERSGIADALYEAMHQWMGSLRGGLSMGTVLICTAIAAMSGVSTAGVVTMGLIALPIMLKRGYNKTIAIGPIMAGGALGILIPPSTSFIIYGMITRTSIGRLFAGGLIPGLILSFLYISYIGVRCYFEPHLGPVISPEERVSLREKIKLTKGLIMPILLIIGVLGSIFGGIASPTEAAAIGAGGALVCAAINRRFNWQLIKEACYRTFTVNAMIMWIIFAAMALASIFVSTGGPQLAKEFLLGLGAAPIFIILTMMFTYFILGCLLDEVAILMLTLPIYMPILVSLGYDPVWFGVLFIVNMQMSYLTPPFGYCLFYMKGVAPPEVTMMDIYRSILPFVGLQAIGLLLVLFFPQLALWLPDVIFRLM